MNRQKIGRPRLTADVSEECYLTITRSIPVHGLLTVTLRHLMEDFAHMLENNPKGILAEILSQEIDISVFFNQRRAISLPLLKVINRQLKMAGNEDLAKALRKEAGDGLE